MFQPTVYVLASGSNHGPAKTVTPAEAGAQATGTIGFTMFQPTVHVLASGRNGTLYVGVTSNLVQRIGQHRAGMIAGFTATHGVHQLVWYEPHTDMTAAIAHEKQLTKWNRAWKLRLIEEQNPQWTDLGDLLEP
jgi:putative endonuclease